ncbi:hypothetical protein AAY473_008713 [Plecturocebus cupreus]
MDSSKHHPKGDPVPFTLHQEPLGRGTSKTAVAAERVALATHGAPPLGMSWSMGSKNLSVRCVEAQQRGYRGTPTLRGTTAAREGSCGPGGWPEEPPGAAAGLLGEGRAYVPGLWGDPSDGTPAPSPARVAPSAGPEEGVVMEPGGRDDK